MYQPVEIIEDDREIKEVFDSMGANTEAHKQRIMFLKKQVDAEIESMKQKEEAIFEKAMAIIRSRGSLPVGLKPDFHLHDHNGVIFCCDDPQEDAPKSLIELLNRLTT